MRTVSAANTKIATLLRKTLLRPAEKGISTLMNERRGDNFFDKPNEQSETCFDFAMAGKNRRRQRLSPFPRIGKGFRDGLEALPWEGWVGDGITVILVVDYKSTHLSAGGLQIPPNGAL